MMFEQKYLIMRRGTYQKSTFGANRRLMKYSSFMAASCRAMAVSRSSSFPVLDDAHHLIQINLGELWKTYTLKTSSAVLRTMNERGSDCHKDDQLERRRHGCISLTVL